MPIEIARHAGFCMGVRRAVDEAQKAADSGKTIVTFGELVHNPQVIERMESIGIVAVHDVEETRGKTV
ncbi:MAG: 4-hydroxy-3-methylbut-2-enyl diphosphate reductase, partial [Clostridia bacterium]|nr:4-hydroxy-3-methylbut-2-enyl diphosphate reductase [Clostridia bacterium]